MFGIFDDLAASGTGIADGTYDTDVTDDLDVCAEAALVRFLDELVLVRPKPISGGDTVGLNGLVGGDDHMDVDGPTEPGCCLAANDAADDLVQFAWRGTACRRVY